MRDRKSVTTLNLDPDELQYFTEHLPRRKSVSQAVREYIQSVNDENRKKVEAHANPINVSFKKGSLDMYIYDSLNNFLNVEPQERMKCLSSLDKPKLTDISIKNLELRQQIQYVMRQSK